MAFTTCFLKELPDQVETRKALGKKSSPVSPTVTDEICPSRLIFFGGLVDGERAMTGHHQVYRPRIFTGIVGYSA